VTDDIKRAQLRAISHPRLDAFRRTVPTLPTSSLITYLSNRESLIALLEWRGKPTSIEQIFERHAEQEFENVIGGAMMAVADEIDRRMPVPG
jgi:hypothetical protein